MGTKESASSTTLHSDTLMRNTLKCLADDFAPFVTPVIANRFKAWSKGSELRDISVPSYDRAPVAVFKRLCQLENFSKRYIYSTDDKSQSELDNEGLSDFISQQAAMSTPSDLTERAAQVLVKAYDIVADVLGEYDKAHHYGLCRFGPKSAYGVPFSKAYLDYKIFSLSGTHAQQYWFYDRLAYDFQLRYASTCHKSQVDGVTQSVKVTPVPKTFKKARMMAPDTVAGGFISQGLGRYIRERLESKTHINLSRAQELHQRLAQKSSVSGYHATADLSRASDSFMSWHLQALLPGDWLRAVMLCSMPKAEVDGVVIPLASRCLMGTGFTFPLQTLLFYAILAAIAELLGRTCKVFVFGDDLIYPRTMHRFVAPILDELGFELNAEKTFPTGNFRESCGGDFYHGVDVRPCMPKGVGQRLTPRDYEGRCYSLINQLLRRWSCFEIDKTLRYLLHEASMASSTGRLCAVPTDMPDYSGIKVDSLDRRYEPIMFYRVRTSRSQRFMRVISTRRVLRLVKMVPIYYWESLRSSAQAEATLQSCFQAPMAFWRYVQAQLLKREKMAKRYLRENDSQTVVRLKPGDLLEIDGRLCVLSKKDKRVGMLAIAKKGTQRYRYTETNVSTWKGSWLS